MKGRRRRARLCEDFMPAVIYHRCQWLKTLRGVGSDDRLVASSHNDTWRHEPANSDGRTQHNERPRIRCIWRRIRTERHLLAPIYRSTSAMPERLRRDIKCRGKPTRSVPNRRRGRPRR
jgi:hypothetical protein